MKTILLTQRLDYIEGYDEIRESLDLRWAAFLNQCGFIAVSMSYEVPVREYFSRVMDIAGVIMTGGNDLAGVSDSRLDRIREDYERELVSVCQEQQLPVIGVCRGMQLLAVELGATLDTCEGHVGAHELNCVAPGRYDFPDRVNSYHNYGIKHGRSGLDVLAIADDNIVEAFANEPALQLGIMWHPERDEPFDKKNIELFSNYFSSRGRD